MIDFSRTITVADLVKELKRVSNHWAQQKINQAFHWQAGYGVFSVAHSQREQVVHYIDNQENHHREHSFQDEFRKLLQRYQIEYDEQYVWD